MGSSSPRQPPSTHFLPAASDMDLPLLLADDSTAPFEWSELFDFTVDDQLFASLDVPADHQQQEQQQQLPPELTLVPVPVPDQGGTSDRVRKRDPRLTCSNFLAGIVPCACPEIDEKMEDVDGGPGKKRPRTGRSGGVARCQVPGCETDIRELKGYHRRHRVCLTCANATSVLIGGENKRYCQQCGKFHLLPDFDEGKRSCRRKLERHNNRRRRKLITRDASEKEAHDVLFEDVSSDGEAGRGYVCSTSEIAEDNDRDSSQDLKDGNVSNICSVLDSQNIPSESITTFAASAETRPDGGKSNSKFDLSPSYGNKSVYSSMCPTGRISFKLYDWNPAEFPRRLRHQIFQWLASMPVELEGYIRPGCTILTAFISMPQFAWMKLFEDPVSCLRHLLAPGGMLWGRGTALVYLNNGIFRLLRDGTSVMKVEVGVRVPKLHSVYPSCFEAGKPMEFFACGSHLLQPKFRSLVSFSGKYLAHDYYVVFPHGKDEIEASVSLQHQQLRINVPFTEPECFGPAFIEVENASGLSNFIPILIADRQICKEIEMIQQKYDPPLFPKNTLPEADLPPCLRRTEFSDLILDIAWVLKKPPLEMIQHAMTLMQIQRFNYLLNFLISNESISILKKILEQLEIFIDEIDLTRVIDGVSDADMLLFQKHLALARGLLFQKMKVDKSILPNINCFPASSAEEEGLSVSSVHHEDLEMETQQNAKHSIMLHECSAYQGKNEAAPILNGEVYMNFDNTREWPIKSCNSIVVKKIISPRSLVYLFTAVAICFGVCAVLFHPYKVGSLAITIRRCLFDDSF
ncbi:Squamosa promoter-binding-like protein [Dionaea muscipula]